MAKHDSRSTMVTQKAKTMVIESYTSDRADDYIHTFLVYASIDFFIEQTTPSGTTSSTRSLVHSIVSSLVWTHLLSYPKKPRWRSIRTRLAFKETSIQVKTQAKAKANESLSGRCLCKLLAHISITYELACFLNKKRFEIGLPFKESLIVVKTRTKTKTIEKLSGRSLCSWLTLIGSHFWSDENWSF